MIRRFSTNFAVASMLIDATMIAGVLWLTGLVRPALAQFLPVKPVGPDFYMPGWLYFVFPIVWVMIMSWLSVYDGSRDIRPVDALSSLSIGALAAGVVLAGIIYLTYRDLSRALFIFFFIFAFLALLGWRLVFLPIYQQHRQSDANKRRIIIAGTSSMGSEVQKRLAGKSDEGIELVGFLGEHEEGEFEGYPMLGSLNEVENITKAQQISDVVVALPASSDGQIHQLVQSLEKIPVKIWIVPDSYQLELQRTRISDFAGLPLLELRAAALDEDQRRNKRLFDVVATLLLLIPGLPIMLVTAGVIFLVDGRPVLLRQKRIGENGKPFTFYKFRTMIHGADRLLFDVSQQDDNGNRVYKLRDDPRITKLGKILRRLSLDELPQLFNVLFGSMSLVGPRPEIPELVEKYQSWQRVRFSVPQGMTGWWQIYGRSDKPMYLNTEEDLYYIQHYSFWLDLQIIVKTIWVVLRGKGAY